MRETSIRLQLLSSGGGLSGITTQLQITDFTEVLSLTVIPPT